VAALALFSVAAGLGAATMAWLRDVPLLSVESSSFGVSCGLVVWLFLAVFHIKKEFVVLPVHDQDTLVANLCTLLEDAGYVPVRRGKDQLTFTPSFCSLLIGGRIRVQVSDTEVRVVGPKVRLKMLRNHIRMALQLEKVQKSYSDARFRQGQALLKRVELSLRISAEQWPAVRQRVLDALTREGAQVRCEVNILAQSEKGIPESTFDLLVGDWLRQQHIPAEMLKEAMSGTSVAESVRPRSHADGESAVASVPATAS
jgi:hypothetical protein